MPGIPMGLGGCRNGGGSYECCEYNVSVFDGKSGESIHEISGEPVKVHHCSLQESSAAVLAQLDNLKILQDDRWELRMLLARIKEKRTMISNSFTQDSLVEAGIFANKARDGARTGDSLAAVWLKCASFSLSDALFSINSQRPSPAHMLDLTRRMKKNETNKTFLLVHQVLGLERASTSVLSRMVKSTMGFSDMVENNGNSEIIRRKYEYLTGNSLLSDCYFYLGYVNRANVLRVKNKTHKNPEYIHVLKVALDIESDPLVVERQATALLQRTHEILAGVKGKA